MIQERLINSVEELNHKQPIKLTWTDLSYKVKSKTILNECSGYALPGQLLSVIGTSGSGKSTFLNALTGSIKCQGHVLLNDQLPMSNKVFGSVGSYLKQDDTIFAFFTVKEALEFAARLKLFNVSAVQQDLRINKLIKELGLTKCQDTLIGNQTRKTISGGERKRTAIGIELITDPSLVVLDEPTSGLDSQTAQSLVKLLHRLVRKYNKTLIMTIHQPSSEKFRLFDRLILICDGRLVYQGEAKLAPRYFSSIGFNFGKFQNPADIFIKIISFEYPKTQQDQIKFTHLITSYEPPVSNLTLPKLIIPKKIHSKFNIQFKELLHRNIVFAIREPTVILTRFLAAAFIGLLQLSVYHGAAKDTQNCIGSFFMIAMSMFYQSVFASVLVFQFERPVFLKEHSNQLYSVGAYYLAKMAIEIPILLVFPLIQQLILFWAIGYHKFGKHYLTLELLVQCGAAIGFMISSIADTLVIAQQITPLFCMPLMLFGGLFVNAQRVFVWLSWIQYLSPIRYCFEALCIAEWQNLKEKRFVYESQLGFGQHSYARCVLLMVALALGFRLLSLVALKIKIMKIY